MEAGVENETLSVILFPLIMARFEEHLFYLGGLLAATKKNNVQGLIVVTFLLLKGLMECSGLENQFGCLTRVARL